MTFVFSFSLQAKELKILSGPTLHLTNDELWGQIRANGFKHPMLEIKQGQNIKSKPLIRLRSHSWKIPFGMNNNTYDLSYRITENTFSTKWYRLLWNPSKRSSFKFVVYGDNREGRSDRLIHQGLLKSIEKENPQFVIHTGDFVVNGNRERHWESLFNNMGDIFSKIPLQPTIGNHDISAHNLFGKYFSLGEHGNDYSFHFLGTTFIVLDSTEHMGKISKQYKFLEKTLQAANKNRPIFVSIHHPAYNYSEHGGDEDIQKTVVPLLEKYGVDVVFSAHAHNYQRLKSKNGITYIISGGGGAPLYSVKPHQNHQSFKQVHHYIVVQVNPNGTVKGWVKNTLGTTEDYFSISSLLSHYYGER